LSVYLRKNERLCGQRFPQLISLVTFLFSDKKVTFPCLGKRSFTEVQSNDKKAAVQMDGGLKLIRLLNYSRVEKCLMVRTI